MATKKQNIKQLEKLQKGTITKNEPKELEDFESKSKNPADKKTTDHNIVPTITAAAKALKCSARTIRNWIGEGAPVRPDKTYDIRALDQWRKERDNRRKPTEAESVDIERKKTQLRLLKMEEKQKMGELISLQEVEKGRVARITAVKSELLAMPRIAKQLENMPARQIEVILKQKVNAIIKKFSGQT